MNFDNPEIVIPRALLDHDTEAPGYLLRIEPDVIVPAQTRPGLPDSGPRRLMRAILLSALAALTSPRRSRGAEQQRIEAAGWLADPETGVVTLSFVCDALGLELEAVQRAVMGIPHLGAAPVTGAEPRHRALS